MGQHAAPVRHTWFQVGQQLRIAMWMRALVVTLGLAAALACGRGGAQPPQNQPHDPLLAGLKAPPLNRPASYVARPPINGGSRLPQGDRPALALVSEGRPGRPIRTLSGLVTARRGLIEIQGTDGVRVQVLYRLPPGLVEPPGLSSPGELSVLERDRAEGDPARQVVVRSDGSLLLAQISLAAAKPVTAELGGGLRLVQRQASGVASEQGYVDVAVEAYDGEMAAGTIPIARPALIRTRAGVFQSFVESSRFTSSYTLRAWVVRSQ
jgi:hypothetical protein